MSEPFEFGDNEFSAGGMFEELGVQEGTQLAPQYDWAQEASNYHHDDP